MTPSQQLRFTIELAAPRVDALSWAFWNHPEFVRIYPAYLQSLYHSMRATVPLLEFAADRAEALGPDDAVGARLAAYYRHHAREELHHDAWLLEDMQVLGLDVEAVRTSTAPADIAELIGAQYYWVAHDHPVSVMGCFAVLEGAPPDPEMLDALAARTGLPPEALRTLRKHGVLDPHHRDDLDDVLDALPLSEVQRRLVGLSALQVIARLGEVMSRLLLVGEPATLPAG
jgi:hypothetical protein